MGEETTMVKVPGLAVIEIKQIVFYSEFLERDVLIDIYQPVKKHRKEELSLLLVNDGQDLRTMSFGSIINDLTKSGSIDPIICVAVHAGADRLHEYGTAYRADYGGRGAKAGLYTKFILDELLPYLANDLNIFYKDKSFAGFSLGALSALDIVWNNCGFAKVGIFSGALWWRRHAYENAKYNLEKDRIMHVQVQKGRLVPGLKFFFECGQQDEIADRNNNGIIDSIEDTTDLINDLKTKGYSDDQIKYVELVDGQHNVETWAKAFPIFLKWGWSKKQ